MYKLHSKNDHSAEYGFSNIRKLRAYKISQHFFS